MLRVIAGTAKGVRLETPKGVHVRPTLDRVREAAFSILLPRIAGARFADLFAGSGANGIEALSRGAEACAFVDSDPRSLTNVEHNLERTHLAGKAACYRLALPDGLGRLRLREAPFHIVFADPPFDFAGYDILLERIAAEALLAPEGVVVIEHAKDAPTPEAAGGLIRNRQSTYGTVTLSFFA